MTVRGKEATMRQHGPEQNAETPVEADSLIEEVSIDGMCGVY